MSRVVIVLPSIVPAMTVACLASLHPSVIDSACVPVPPTRQRDTEIRTVDGPRDVRLVTVWNTPGHNLGVAGSWNVGVDEVLRTEADWLVILSAAVRFGAQGGRDFLDQLDWQAQSLGLEAGDGLGWHVIAFPRRVLETVGRFDPIYEVGYFEDVDYSWRLQCAYQLGPDDYPLWPKVSIDAALVEVAHGIKRGGVTVDMAGNEQRFRDKWGGPSGAEQWCHPYNEPTLDWAFTGCPLTVRATCDS